MMLITNKSEVDEWLFQHAQIKGNRCVSVKGNLDGENVNVAWKDTVTGETITIKYDGRYYAPVTW